MIQLRGMTWNHDRGLAPMLATAKRFCESHPEVEIEWEVRSLRDFGDAPVESLADEFDLAVLDHPFMGDLASARCFLPFDELLSSAQMQEFAADSVGQSHASYRFDDRQWLLAIDAASQVASYRADLLSKHGVSLPQTWEEVLALARLRQGFVSLALTPLDSLMSFFSICANVGDPCFQHSGRVVSGQTGDYALNLLRQLAAHAAPTARAENPIALYERMSSSDDTAYCPLAFGYSNYSRAGYRSNSLSYGSIPSAGFGTAGAVLGGAGIAVSASCAHRDIAVEYAAWVAGRLCQSGLYVNAGGQPARKSAWESKEANELTGGYFGATLPVLERAWLRPRYAGFVPFQNAAGQVIAQYLDGALSARDTLAEFDDLLSSSLRGKEAW